MQVQLDAHETISTKDGLVSLNLKNLRGAEVTLQTDGGEILFFITFSDTPEAGPHTNFLMKYAGGKRRLQGTCDGQRLWTRDFETESKTAG